MHAACSFEEMQRYLSEHGFEKTALSVFRYQAAHNPIYKRWIHLRGLDPMAITQFEAIPYLPIDAFRSFCVSCFPESSHGQVYISSGTTNQQASRHFVKYPEVYKASLLEGFRLRFGNPDQWRFYAMLPSYMERGNASLVYMVSELMKASGQDAFLFFKEPAELHRELLKPQAGNKKSMLFAVTYALLDWIESLPSNHPELYIVETGGMKGRRKEISRDELHDLVKRFIHPKKILSEYGMTEMLSQAWMNGEGNFVTPPWLSITFSEPDDFLNLHPSKGCIRFTDLANMHSCSFVQTADLGEQAAGHSFRVLGRLDNSEIRGCNLMWN